MELIPVNLTKQLKPFKERICMDVLGRHGMVEFTIFSHGSPLFSYELYCASCRLCGYTWLLTEESMRIYITHYQEKPCGIFFSKPDNSQ